MSKNIKTNSSNSNSKSLEELFSEAMIPRVDEVAPDFNRNSMPKEDVPKVINILASGFDIKPSLSLVAIILLFLKGAGSGGTPITLSVEVGGKEISKRDLLNAYQMVTQNTYLRRLAEALAVEIGSYAEKNNLRGELAHRIETAHRAATGEALSNKELAWCSSFSQSIPDLAERSSERLAKLLAEDYTKRFGTVKGTPKPSGKNASKGTTPPRGAGKPKKKGSADEGPVTDKSTIDGSSSNAEKAVASATPVGATEAVANPIVSSTPGTTGQAVSLAPPPVRKSRASRKKAAEATSPAASSPEVSSLSDGISQDKVSEKVTSSDQESGEAALPDKINTTLGSVASSPLDGSGVDEGSV